MCKRKYGSRFSNANDGSWWPRSSRWWRRDGRKTRSHALSSAYGDSGESNNSDKITNQYQYGAKQTITDIHPFRKHFEELQVGDTLITEKHTVTLQDIEDFADLSGDKFYAHMDEKSLEGTFFTGRVAHGYFILSRAAGLFVDPPKGPVLLNYGLDECRFIKPVYPGATIGVRFTCKEKIDQEKKSPEDIGKGIVKWLVDVYDETGDSVAIATILTMVKKKDEASLPI